MEAVAAILVTYTQARYTHSFVGRGAVVAASDAVFTDVEPATVVAGNPASLVKRFA